MIFTPVSSQVTLEFPLFSANLAFPTEVNTDKYENLMSAKSLFPYHLYGGTNVKRTVDLKPSTWRPHIWFRVISDFLTMHFTDDLGSVYTPTSVWSIDRSKNETTAQMRCFISHRQQNGLTCLEVTGLTTVDVSISHIIVVGRTKLKCPSHYRYSPFPSASHPTLSSNAVEVKLTTIDCRSGNLTRIAL
jgi:hypothetical protein